MDARIQVPLVLRVKAPQGSHLAEVRTAKEHARSATQIIRSQQGGWFPRSRVRVTTAFALHLSDLEAGQLAGRWQARGETVAESRGVRGTCWALAGAWGPLNFSVSGVGGGG